MKKSIITAAMALTLFGGATFTTLTEPINVSAKRVTKSHGLKRYKANNFGKLPAGVPYPTSPKFNKWGYVLEKSKSETKLKKAAISLNSWLIRSGKKTSGTLHDSKGYIIPGRSQKVYRMSGMDEGQYAYISTMANGHKMYGKSAHRGYNLEFIPGFHDLNSNFSNPENGKNWVVYYVKGNPNDTWFGSKRPAGFKELGSMPNSMAWNFETNFMNPNAVLNAGIYNSKTKVLVMNYYATVNNNHNGDN